MVRTKDLEEKVMMMIKETRILLMMAKRRMLMIEHLGNSSIEDEICRDVLFEDIAEEEGISSSMSHRKIETYSLFDFFEDLIAILGDFRGIFDQT